MSKKISELTAASALTGAELVEVVQGGTNKRTTTQGIADLAGAASSGTYTPTLTNGDNVADSTASVCQWLRVGSVVTVSGSISIDPTSATTFTRIGISLPVASNFASTNQCSGTASIVLSGPVSNIGFIAGETTNNRAQLDMIPNGTGNVPIFFTFTYLIV